jgi:hypothetical protein
MPASAAATLRRVSSFESCAVCGRTILSGERTRSYLSPDGESRAVCDLCRGRAEQLGWVWEEVAGEAPSAPPKRRRSGGLGGLRRRRAESRRSQRDEASSSEPEAPEQPPAAPAAERSPDPAAPGAGVGRPEPVAETPGTRLERAAARFNASAQSRTVAGLIRSLGAPWVSVGAAAGSPSEVRITVAWELSWYQWGVDLRDEARPVHPIDKGHEIAELDRSARQWNAIADEAGQIQVSSVAAAGRTGKGA